MRIVALQVLIDPWHLIPLLLGPPSVDMGPSLNLTVGALLLGVLFTAVCVIILYLLDVRPQVAQSIPISSGFGITTMQTYLYMTRFPKDPKGIRWTVSTSPLLSIFPFFLLSSRSGRSCASMTIEARKNALILRL